MSAIRIVLVVGVVVAGNLSFTQLACAQKDFQYKFEEILIPPATASEPRLERFSTGKAIEYLDQGATAWSGSRKCISCHTNGIFNVVRPALSSHFGRPEEESRAFLVKSLRKLQEKERDKLLRGVQPAQAIFIAAGLAEWDAHVTGQLAPETKEAFKLVFDLQLESGTWGSADCWPPFESSAFHEATVAAMAVGTAPGYRANLKDRHVQAGIERLKKYLRTQPPPHDYGRTCLLWAACRMPDLLDNEWKQALIETVLSHQREDGGWSIRTFSDPEKWGRGNRAKKLRAEPEFENPPSDGHQTGLAIIVLREAGVSAGDARIQRGVKWLLTNQRQSGRWWTRSLNTDRWHFITYSGTAYPLLALKLCDALPAAADKTTVK